MTEIAFLTLFLGLTAGAQDVAVDVRGPVAAVEIRLDAVRVALIERAPWQVRVDFGTSLLPHRLEARALDAKGTVLARRTQLLNLPRPPAETEWLLERDAQSRVVSGRLVWQNLTNAPPQATVVQLDGKPRPVDATGRVDLAGLAPDTIHVLSAELRFAGGAVARADAAFGGDLGEQAGGELTALLVASSADRSLAVTGPPRDAVLALGVPRPAVAVEQGAGVILVVRQPSALGALCRGVDDSSYGRFAQGAPGAVSGSGPGEPHLAASDTLRFLWPWIETDSHGAVPFRLFPSSPEIDASRGRLSAILCRADATTKPRALRLTDAVALAALQATAGSRRRAVLLILGQDEADASQFSIHAVREYVHALHVPLVVWRTGAAKAPAAQEAWGESSLVDSPPAVRRALVRLLRNLDQQRIVWVDGGYLPNELTLSPTAGLRFADEAEP